MFLHPPPDLFGEAGVGEPCGPTQQRVLAIEQQLRSVLLESRSNRKEARLWLTNALAAVPLAEPRLKRWRLAQFLPGGSASRGAEHEGFARQLLLLLFEAAPERVGALLAESPRLVSSFFDHNRKAIPSWFGHFSMGGLGEFRHGAAALANYALAHRGEVWDLLVWGGKHPQAPVAVAQRPHYFCELDIPATVRALLRECPRFWESREMREATAGGALLALDPAFFAQKLYGWLVERSARSERLFDLACDLLEDTPWRTLVQALLPALPQPDLVPLSSGLLDELPYPRAGAASGAGAGPLQGAWLVFRGAAWGGLDELLLAAALGCALPQVLRTVADDEIEAEEMDTLVAELAAGETAAAHWQLRRGLADQPLELRRFLLVHLWATHHRVAKLASSRAAADVAALQSLLQASGVSCELVASEARQRLTGGGSSSRKRKKERKRAKKQKRHRSGRSARRRSGSSSEDEGGGAGSSGDDGGGGGGGRGSGEEVEAGEAIAWRVQAPGGGSPTVMSPLELVDYVTTLAGQAYADWVFCDHRPAKR